MVLDSKLKKDIEDIKEIIVASGRYCYIDSINELVNLATSKQLVEETLDESYEALKPIGSTIIENITINVYGKEILEDNNKESM